MKKELLKIILSVTAFILAMITPLTHVWLAYVLFFLSYIIVGFEVIKKAFKNLKKGRPLDENFLMTVATIGAFCIDQIPEAIAVMVFYQIGELFQDYAVDKSRKSIASLMDIRPDYANVIRNNDEVKLDPEEVQIDEIIVVKPGEKIPLDGIVVEGESQIDTKALTGESLPRSARIDDEVLSGSINLNGVVKIRVTKEYKISTVSKILDLVENASSQKSKSENFITKFAKYYTPIVVFIAVILAVVPPIVMPNTFFTDWLYRALSFLVVSCPCALVISIPLSFFSGIGAASKIGILIKGSNYLEVISKAEIVVMDKTGTLTEGVFNVQKVNAVNYDEAELLELTAYSENYSTHPIATSIKKHYGKEIDENKIVKIEELSGLGIRAEINLEGDEAYKKIVLAGNERLMNENQISFEPCEEIGTVVYVAINGSYAGYILIADKIKDDAIQTIKDFKRIGIKQTVMLTGDRKNVGESVAKKLGMDQVYTELLPDGKVEKVEELLKQKSTEGKLIFAGDGINDAPVLALADIGVAMGGMGSDAAIEAADIVIMNDEPSKILSTIRLSKKTMRIVKQNIIFAIFVKILVLILSAIGISSMWEAVFADVGVSIIAILNALRILKNRE